MTIRHAKPYPSKEAAENSKKGRTGDYNAVQRACGCEGNPWHLEAKSAAAERKPQKDTARKTRLRPVSRKRAAEIRERRTMLQAKYPDRPLCEVPYCNRFAHDAHEPLTRARGGSITDPGNVKAVCRPHHDEITFEEPEWAYELGFLVHSWEAA